MDTDFGFYVSGISLSDDSTNDTSLNERQDTVRRVRNFSFTTLLTAPLRFAIVSVLSMSTGASRPRRLVSDLAIISCLAGAGLWGGYYNVPGNSDLPPSRVIPRRNILFNNTGRAKK